MENVSSNGIRSCHIGKKRDTSDTEIKGGRRREEGTPPEECAC